MIGGTEQSFVLDDFELATKHKSKIEVCRPMFYFKNPLSSLTNEAKRNWNLSVPIVFSGSIAKKSEKT